MGVTDSHNRAGFSRRGFLKATGIAAFTAGIAGCQTLGEDDTLQFGGPIPLTGPLAQAGGWIERGWGLWVEETNSDGGLLDREIELTTYDHENDSSAMRSATSRLLEDDQVDVLLGTYPTVAVPVVNDIADRHGTPVLHIFEPNSMIEDRLDDPDAHPWSFGLVNANRTYPQTFVDFVAGLPEGDRPERMACVGRNDLLGEESSQFSRAAADEHGIEVVADEFYDPESGDLSPVIRGIRDSNPDIIMGGSYPGDTILLARAINDVDIDVDFVWMMVGPQEPAVIESLGNAGNGLYGSTMWVHSLPTEETQRIVDIARDEWDATPPYQYGAGYAQLQAYGQAIETAGSVDADAVQEEFETGSFDTVAGDFEFNERHVSTIQHALTQSQDGSIEVVWPDDLKTADYATY